MNDDELMHYGKIGMKWGKRKASSASSSKTTSTSTAKSDGKPRLSDAELQSRINRISMEQKYAKLTEKQTSPGKKMAMDILSTAFKSTAQAYVTKMMGNALNNLTTPKTGPTPTPNPFRTPSSTANTSTAEPRSSTSRVFTGPINTGSPRPSYSRDSSYVYPNFRLLN